MASVNDKFIYAAPLWVGEIGAGGVANSTVTTIPIASATGLTNGYVYVGTIDRVDGSGEETPNEKETFIGVLSGTDFINCLRGVEGTAQAHDAGAKIEILFTAKQWNLLVEGLLEEHGADGKHTADLISALKASGEEVTTGTEDAKIVTPKAIADAGIVALTKAAGSDINTGTDDAKYVTSKAIADSSVKTVALEFVIDGGGAAITTGVKGDLEIPFACTINAVTLIADQSGSIVVDIWKDSYANFPPTDADSITASAVPTISSATKAQDTTLTGWTTEIAAGSILRFNVDSCTTIQRCTVSLKVTRS